MSRADVDPADTERAVRIDLAAVRHNVGVLRERIRRPDGSRPLLTAVVKADAYGHGAVAVPAPRGAGADRLGGATCARPACAGRASRRRRGG
ncbi:alanine racemase, partial [Micrococcus luteus]